MREAGEKLLQGWGIGEIYFRVEGAGGKGKGMKMGWKRKLFISARLYYISIINQF